MPIFAAFLGTLFTTVWTMVQTYLIAKLLLRITAITLLYAAWSQLKTVTDTATAGAFQSLPGLLGPAATWIIPPQMPAIISMIITVETGLLAYRWAKVLFGVRTTA
jgi:hypothetical protein